MLDVQIPDLRRLEFRPLRQVDAVSPVAPYARDGIAPGERTPGREAADRERARRRSAAERDSAEASTRAGPDAESERGHTIDTYA